MRWTEAVWAVALGLESAAADWQFTMTGPLGHLGRYPAQTMGINKGKTRFVPILLGVAFALGFVRGGYLLGWPAGIVLGSLLAFSTFLLTDAFRSNASFKPLRIVVASCFFCFAIAFIVAPTLISQDIQYSIDDVSNERKMRSELHRVFASDARFSSLRPNFTQLKCTSITMTGSLPDSSALDDVRAAIGDTCPTVCELALVSWNIRLDDSGEQVSTNDGRIGQNGAGDHDAG